MNVLSPDAKSISVTTVTVTVQAECEALLTYHILRASALDKQVNNDLSIASASQASQEKVNVEVEAYVQVREYRIFIPLDHQAGVVYVPSSLRYLVVVHQFTSVTQFTDLFVNASLQAKVAKSAPVRAVLNSASVPVIHTIDV